MEVNNNDPNNNDIVIEDRMDSLNEEVPLSSLDQNAHERLFKQLVKSDYIKSYTSDSSDEEYYQMDEERVLNLCKFIYDSESSNEFDMKFGTNITEDYSSVRTNNSEKDDLAEVDNINSSTENDSSAMIDSSVIDAPMISHDNEIPGENIIDLINHEEEEEEIPMSSNRIKSIFMLVNDYRTIESIVAPNLSTLAIFKCLYKHRNHDKRLLASIWDLMHIIDKPRSLNGVNATSSSDNKKKFISVPGTSNAFTKSNVLHPNKNQEYRPVANNALCKRKLSPQKQPFASTSQPGSSNSGTSLSEFKIKRRKYMLANLPYRECSSKNSFLDGSNKQTATSLVKKDSNKSSKSLSNLLIKSPSSNYTLGEPNTPNKEILKSKPVYPPSLRVPTGFTPKTNSPVKQTNILNPPKLINLNSTVNKQQQHVAGVTNPPYNVFDNLPVTKNINANSSQTSSPCGLPTQKIVTSTLNKKVEPSATIVSCGPIFSTSKACSYTIVPNSSNCPNCQTPGSSTSKSSTILTPPTLLLNNLENTTSTVPETSSNSPTKAFGSNKRSATCLISGNLNTATTSNYIKPATLTIPDLPISHKLQNSSKDKTPLPKALSVPSIGYDDKPRVTIIPDNQKYLNDNHDCPEDALLIDVEVNMHQLRNKKVFKQLSTLFETVRKEYIFMLCLKYDKLMENNSLLDFLIDVLLANGHKYSTANIQQVTKLSLLDKYTDLQEIFPDADPTFLQAKATEFVNDTDKFKNFVQENLENKNYPTKEEYLKRQKIREQLEQYINNFNVVQFLDIFPNPFAHFENRKRISNIDLSLAYLKIHYTNMRIDTIQKTFRNNYKNLTLTVKALDTMKSNMKGKRYRQPVSTENIPFAQEIAFIRHRAEIENYISEKEENDRREFNELKASGCLLECQCCYSDECIPSKCSTCGNGHVFCDSCIVRGTNSKLGDGDTHVLCFMDCGSEFPLSVLQKVLKPTKFSILLKKRQEAEIMAAGLEGLVSCPFCHFASIPPAEDKVFKCLNQECMKETCRSCKELNHVPLSCEETKSGDKARHYLEEQMTEALVRICYNCKKPFFKEEGCNKMTCTCGAKMCYICSEPIKSYNHFRGQGSDELELCPLYTDDALLNADVVRRVAKKTANNLMQQNPNVRLDTEMLMPKLPASKNGPHNTIVNVQHFPVHALKARPYADDQ